MQYWFINTAIGVSFSLKFNLLVNLIVIKICNYNASVIKLPNEVTSIKRIQAWFDSYITILLILFQLWALCFPWKPTQAPCPGKQRQGPSVPCRYHVNPDQSCLTHTYAQVTTCAERMGNSGYWRGVPPRADTAFSAEKHRSVSRARSPLRTVEPFVLMMTGPNSLRRTHTTTVGRRETGIIRLYHWRICEASYQARLAFPLRHPWPWLRLGYE